MKNLLLSITVAFSFNACQTTAPDRFAQADQNGDNKLTAEEANTYEVTNVFEALDKNKDGKLTMEEFNASNDRGIAKRFGERDTNKDGIVTLPEAKTYQIKKGTYTSAVHEADTNKDGFVSREEAKAYYASKE